MNGHKTISRKIIQLISEKFKRRSVSGATKLMVKVGVPIGERTFTSRGRPELRQQQL